MRNGPLAEKSPNSVATLWGELEHVCATVHDLWYVQRRKIAARRYLGRLGAFWTNCRKMTWRSFDTKHWPSCTNSKGSWTVRFIIASKRSC